MTKPPTAQGISRLLAAAGFERCPRHGKATPGFFVMRFGTGKVIVAHIGEYDRPDRLDEYAEAVRTAGWKTTSEGPQRFVVTAEETPSPTGEGQ